MKKAYLKQKISALAAVIFALVLFLNFCYSIYDVRGLVFYKDEKITGIYPFGDKVYMITEDGCGYVTGGNSNSASKKYRSAAYRTSDTLGMICPVRFFEGKIKNVLPYMGSGAFFITENNELYSVFDFEVKKLAGSAVHATASDHETVYFVDTENKLWKLERGEKSFLLPNVKTAEACLGRLFVLGTDGRLCELLDGGELSAPIFSGVSAFSVHDTSLRYIDGRYVYDDAEGIANPLFNVLTDDGTLYAKGYYNLLSCGYGGLMESKPIPKYISDWKVIGENVAAYSSSVMGTAMIYENGRGAYYGFDTEMSLSSDFGCFEFEQENVSAVYAGTLCIYLETGDGKRYVWGTDYSPLIKEKGTHNIFTGTAKELDF